MKILRQVRRKSGISIYRVAKELDVDRTHYLRIERGEANPSAALAIDIERFWKDRGFPQVTSGALRLSKVSPRKKVTRKRAA